MKIGNCKLKIRERDGQLLIELLIALFVGGMFILGATLGVTSIVRYSFETKGNQIASGFGNDMLNDVKSLTDTAWHNLYDLSKGTTYHYYLSQRASSSVVVGGDESMLDNDVQANLVGQWKFDEDTGTTTYDSSGNGNDGTLTNAPTRVNPSSCVVGSCLQFNGGSYVDTGSSSTTVVLNTFTINTWFKPTAANEMTIFAYSKGLPFSSNTELRMESDMRAGGSPDLRWIVYNNGSLVTDVGAPDGSVSLNTWTMGTITDDGTTIKVYLNGVLKNSGSAVVGSNPGYYTGLNKNFISMLQRDASVAGFYGNIDDFRIYNRALTTDEISKLYNSSVYTRYFTVENVGRDASSNIASSGGTDDPSTQKVTATVKWEGGRQIQLFHYMLRKDSFILWNNDWSGGSGVSGPVTTATSSFASSSNVVYHTPALITVNSTSSAGWLESSTFDTQIAGGAAINSVLWQGTQPAGTSVQFQIAASNNSSGPWNYYGYDGSGSTYFSPASPNVSVSVTNFNNFRYFRYKLFLNPYGNSGPTVTDAVINWSR